MVVKIPSGIVLPIYARIQVIREHQQKVFVRLSRFWLLKGWEGEGFSESSKKGNCMTKIFSDNVE